MSQPDRPKGRGQRVAATPTKELAVLCGVPVLQPTKLKDEEFLSAMAALRPDLGVVAAYGRILPDALLQIPRLGMINVHGSLLPKYRGAAPVHRAVIDGEPVTGITIMRVVKELDAGPMLATRSSPIGPDATSAEVERQLSEIGASLLLTVVEQLARGDEGRGNAAGRLAGDLRAEDPEIREPDRLVAAGRPHSQHGPRPAALAAGFDDDRRRPVPGSPQRVGDGGGPAEAGMRYEASAPRLR